MSHKVIELVLSRADRAKSDSEFSYFFSLLLAAEALAKTVTLTMVSAITDDKDRNRYRLEHQLVRASGLGDWGTALEDALTGQASHYLFVEAHPERAELTKLCRSGDWQYESVRALKDSLNSLEISSEDVPVKSDMKRWFRLFATMRNKTRAHGATQHDKAKIAAEYLRESIEQFYKNFSLFQRPWAYLHRNLSGKYRVSQITNNANRFDYLKRDRDHSYPDGVYVFLGSPRKISLLQSNPELSDFFFANGGFKDKSFELLSYFTDNKEKGDSSIYLIPPGTLPPSETEGHGELLPKGSCFTNVPDVIRDYVPRITLESDLRDLLLDDKRPIVTLVGRGGIGKTSLALKVINLLYDESRYEAVVWLSARDVDLQLTGPKPVRPLVLSPEDMGKFFATLVLSPEEYEAKGFDSRKFLESQLHKSEIGPCLFVFDNFETTRNPIEMFNWIDTFIRLPNKVLITTRLRDFKGDYPLEVHGMTDEEARKLIDQTARQLKVFHLLTPEYISDVVSQSGGHPYVIKVLMGEVAKAQQVRNVERIVAGSEEILTALFERTYASLSPCAQRAFLTLAAWASAVPRIALEAVLLRSTEERQEVEKGIESLIQFSMAEIQIAPTDHQEFLSLPLVASVFGRKKLNVSPTKAAITADVEILQMLGPSRSSDIHLGLAKKIERFISNISQRIDEGASFKSYEPILDMICRSYNTGWLLLARWHMETRTPEGYERAKLELRRFLENDPDSADAMEAWGMLGDACYLTNDSLGEVHALVERTKINTVPFHDISNTANLLNIFFSNEGFSIDKDEKRNLANDLLNALDRRKSEANSDDFSRMSWLAIHLDREEIARDYTRAGLERDIENYHCLNLAKRLGIAPMA